MPARPALEPVPSLDAPPLDGAGVSLLVPAYNEEHGLESVLRSVEAALDSTDLEYEIVVVDDGSSDRTAQAARGDRVRLIRHPSNRGYGAALKSGLRHARFPIIAITDADGTYPSERLPELLGHLVEQNADMVVGRRSLGRVAIPWVRRPAKWILGRLADFACGRSIPDVNSGLRVFRRDTALLFYSLFPDGFSFTTTITLAMESNAFAVHYLPIEYHKRIGRSKIRPISDTLNFLHLILRIALYFSPLKIFLPLALALTLAGAGWGFFSFSVLDRFADTSTLVLLLAGLQIGVVGLLAEIINHRVPNSFRRAP
ncbi:MAG: glycosyltransferase family 2 protein [Acidobacteriota bacterium]